ncbi:MAG: hypothetical protein LLF94_12415 [Chlamydiales bacterium]|nr:hypothetical protein [Chlamydiales bacterium]
MKAYKGLNEKMQGYGEFQYELGKTYETDKAKACECGFHACTEPFDVFNYFDPANSRYFEVETEGKFDKDKNDSKLACTKITISAEIGLPGIIKAGVDFILERAKNVKTNTGDQSAATNTGNRSAATNTGNYSAATNTGYRSAATNTGNYSAATNTGDQSAATNTGYQSVATNIGNYSAATVEGKDSVACALGCDCKAKGALGCAIVVTERGDWDGETYPLLKIKAAIVDGKKIKVDTFYKLVGGKFVEVKE